MVLLNNQHPSEFVYSVAIDNRDGGYQATRHLIDLGHREIYRLRRRPIWAAIGRRALCRVQARHGEAKLPIRRDYVVRGDGRPGKGRERTAELLDRKRWPTAIFCYNDMTALGAWRKQPHEALSRAAIFRWSVSTISFSLRCLIPD